MDTINSASDHHQYPSNNYSALCTETEFSVPVYDEIEADSILNSVISDNTKTLYTSEFMKSIQYFYFINYLRVNSLITYEVGCCFDEGCSRYSVCT